MARRLTVDGEAGGVETPFWLTGRDGRRQPLSVSRQGKETIRIAAADRDLGALDPTSGDRVEQLTRLLERSGYLLRPRAVTLTLFTRMILADWFVHGVGGAGYERIGDYLFERYYGRRPPPVALATCTMTLPPDGSFSGLIDGTCQVKHELRTLQHHPERYLPEPLAKEEPVATLVHRKRAALNRANDRSLPHDQRKSAWLEITRVNLELLPYARRAADGPRQRLVEAERRARSEKVRACREYFFGLFPEPQLRALQDSVSREEFLTSSHRPCRAGPISVDRDPGGVSFVSGDPDDQSDDCSTPSR